MSMEEDRYINTEMSEIRYFPMLCTHFVGPVGREITIFQKDS